MNFLPESWHPDLPRICAVAELMQGLKSVEEAQEAQFPRLLSEISQSREHEILIRLVAQRWAEDPCWYGAVNSAAGNILISQSLAGHIFAVGVSFGVNTTQPRISSPVDSLLTSAGTCGLNINISDLSAPTDFAVPDPALHVGPRRQVFVPQHATIAVPAGTVWDYADTDSMVIKLELASRTPLCFHFEPESGRYMGASLATAADSQLLAFIVSMRATGTSELAPVLARYTEHASHWVRWETVKTVAELDSDLAVQLIRKLADDPHPEIRAAAHKTLEGVA